MDSLPLVAVTVHPDGAVITRRGRLALSEGAALVRGLPLLLDPSSVRVRAPGLDQVRIHLDVHGADRADEPAARQALREAQGTLSRLEGELDLLSAQRRRLTGLRPPLPGEKERREAPTPERLDQWLRLEVELTGPWAEDLDDRTRALVREVDEAREVRDRARDHLRWCSSAEAWKHWAPTRRLELRLDTEDAVVEIEVSYRVPGATWTAAYALHTTEALVQGRWVIRALVAQATGEDWEGVGLTLSSTPSARVVELPELPALRLGAAQPPAPSPWRDLPEGLDDLFPEAPSPAVGADREQPAPAPPPQPGAYGSGARHLDADSVLAEAPSEQVEGANLMMRSRSVGLRKVKRRAEPAPMAAPQAATFSAAAMDEPMPPEPPEPSGGLEVGDDLLDYASLRLRGWKEEGRGTLHRVGLAAEVSEAGLPATAVAYLRDLLRTLGRKARLVRREQLPPHHVVPGPVEGLDFHLVADGSVDIPSTGRFCAVVVQEEPLALSVRYRTVPRHDPRAFRAVTATLGRDTPLPPGPMDVILGGALALTSPWRGSPGGGEVELGLGVEQGLKIVRNVRYEEEHAGLLGGSRRLHTRLSVEVASSLVRAARVEVVDRVPVSKDDDVKVEVVAAEPAAEAWEGEPDGPVLEGARLQVLDVSPGGEGEATLHYTVTLGGRQELVGGDRRG